MDVTRVSSRIAKHFINIRYRLSRSGLVIMAEKKSGDRQGAGDSG